MLLTAGICPPKIIIINLRRCLFSTHKKASLRTHTCGELRKSDAGKMVTLCGWLYNTRVSSSFLLIKDAYGVTQVTLDAELRRVLPPTDSVIKVSGVVHARPEKDINKSMETGKIEVKAEKIEVLNPASEHIPIKMKERTGVNEQLGLKYRYLQLRNDKFQKRLRFRSEFLRKLRNHLCEELDFVDVETPYLFKRTPGGAQEFIVPTKIPGKFYSLPQSPQQFKQLLMVSGIDRYVQIARCFRDELARPDRQPEFTQLDIEASFITKDDIYGIIESTLSHAWPEVTKFNEGIGQLETPFPRMSYEYAIRNYGSDKPDVRFEMKLQDSNISGDDKFAYFIIPVDHAKPLSKSFFQKMLSLVMEKDHLKLSVLPYENLKHLNVPKAEALSHLKPGEVAILSKGFDHSWMKALGTARTLVAKQLHSLGIEVYKPGFFFLWVEDFPLFSRDEDGKLVSEHHPFTAPVEKDMGLLYSDPEKVHGQHYDLVCNGQEVGGGSIRIHNSDMQRYVLEKIIGEDASTLKHLLEALSFGAPPHGGIALGLDRLVAILTGAQTVRDVIAFPKNSEGRDLLSDSPDVVPPKDLDRYFIKIQNPQS